MQVARRCRAVPSPAAAPWRRAIRCRSRRPAAVANGISTKLHLPFSHPRRQLAAKALHFVEVGPAEEQKFADALPPIFQQGVGDLVIGAEQRGGGGAKKRNCAGPQGGGEPFGFECTVEC